MLRFNLELPDLLVGWVRATGVTVADSSPQLIAELDRVAADPTEHGLNDEVRIGVRNLLRGHGYKPSGRGKPASVSRPRLDPEEGIGLARQSGAVPVLAHPHTLGISRAADMADVLTRLRKAGLIGLEAIYSSYQRHEREGYADLARRFDLVPSGGSDYHGTYKQGLDLGTGYGDLVVPDSTVDELRSHAEAT